MGTVTLMQSRSRASSRRDRTGTERKDSAGRHEVDSLNVLAASFAHEVSQPLSGIMTNACTCLRMLSANAPNIEGACETARRAIRDVQRVEEIVKRLRTLFVGRQIAIETVDLKDTVREVLAWVSSDLDRAQVRVSCALADPLPSVSGDRVQLQQVLLNLVRNAIDAMATVERPRELTISARLAENGQVLVTVRDAGIGFASDHADKVFAPFYTTKPHGMGIGLAVSRSMMEQHGGKLWAAPNADGPGATFSLSIPAAASVSRPTCNELRARPYAAGTVLVAGVA